MLSSFDRIELIFVLFLKFPEISMAKILWLCQFVTNKKVLNFDRLNFLANHIQSNFTHIFVNETKNPIQVE